MTVLFKVIGKPVPEPRPRVRTSFVGSLVALRSMTELSQLYRHLRANAYVPKDHAVHVWRHQVRQAFEAAGGKMQEGPLFVSLGIVTTRPTRMVWKRKAMPREWDVRGGHGASGDCDNFAKSTMDALTGLAWEDDAQVVRLSVSKVIAAGDEQPGAFVKISGATPLS